MKILLIIAHPDPSSFNHAIAAVALAALERNGHDVTCHDLYQEHFDPLLPAGEIARSVLLDPVIGRHCQELATADGIVIVHPNWWGQPPAILKGWIDRVFRAGIAYRFDEEDNGEGVPVGLLVARAALIFNTSNTRAERELIVFGDPLETLWRNCIFDLCGVHHFERRMYRVVCTSTLEERRQWLADVQELTARTFPGSDEMADRREDKIRLQMAQLLACHGNYRQLQAEQVAKRMAWWESRRETVVLNGPLPRQAYRLFLLDYLGLYPAEVPVVYEDDQKITWRSFNFCPTLVACQRLGLDTRDVCQGSTEQSVQALISQLDPRLHFSRNYVDGIRPYAPYCEESIELIL